MVGGLFAFALIFGAIALFYQLCKVLLREPKDIQQAKRSPIPGGIEDDRQKRGQRAIDNLEVTLSSNYLARSVRIEYTDKTKKYFAKGKEYNPDSPDDLDVDFEALLEIPITVTDFFYEADEAARKWIETGPRLEQAGALRSEGEEAKEKEEIREVYCSIFPKDFLRIVGIAYRFETQKYFVQGSEFLIDDENEYDQDFLERLREEIPIAMTDSFYEAEEEAWKWIQAGPSREVL